MAADAAAKTALLLGTAGPRWLDRRRFAGRFLDHGGEATVTAAWREAVAA